MAAAAARVFRGCRFLMSPAASAGGKRPASAKVAMTEAAEPKKSGILKPLPVSDALRRFAGGTPEVSRAGATKLIWDYIKANGLQNPANKKEIYCDEKLKSLFAGRDKIGMLEIAKLLSPHFIKAN
ncbi:protein TRI1-like [Oryza brachyantha]|uniref:DM2 domain-containing protein n=1 Tax=Oryza brachyantha TaxID=4533 RepID=J3L9A9_ORYBR|nr:protein TRI1-like [Oryza brachyantha]